MAETQFPSADLPSGSSSVTPSVVGASITAPTFTLPSSVNTLPTAHHHISIKLTNHNYLFWRTQIEPFLDGQDITDYIDGSKPKPPTTDPDQKAWSSIMSMIISSLTEETMHLAIGKKTSSNLWQAIEHALGSTSETQSLSLFTQLQALRQGDSTSADYIGQAKIILHYCHLKKIEAIQDLERKLRDAAFRVEDEIEFHIKHLYEAVEETLGTWPSLRLCNILQQAIEDIDAIQEELVKVKNEYDLQGWKTTLDTSQISYEVTRLTGYSSQYALRSKVSIKNDFKTIKTMLMEHTSKDREVISIVGMAGLGKTTLAKRVFEDQSVDSHFDIRLWAIASQLYNKRQILISLLNSIGKAESGTDEELALKLYQGLKYQRYLVVMDDIWSLEAWDAVKGCFPDDNIGSRVLVTTRFEEVAYYTRSGNDFFHQMYLLNEIESWDIFSEKACRFRDAPAEFEVIGRPIVEKCKGLPLSIAVIAGLLSKCNTLEEWRNISTALNSSPTTSIFEECSKILSLSCNHLAYHLKACFLYLAIFPEDEEIYVKDLVRLWAAEGLVRSCENKSFEVAAERNIQELEDRNLIFVSKRSCCGRKIKAFRLHDILHSFCVKEARKQNLLHVVRENGSHFPQKGFRWVSIQSIDCDISTLYAASKNCRSIFYFLFDVPKAASLKLEIFNLLRILYFNDWDMHIEIVDLVHLRYLHQIVRSSNILNPFRAWNLQTLHIYADDEMNYFEFQNLQYLYCQSICEHHPKFVHQNLKSISLLDAHQCTKEFFKNVPYLNKVRIRGERRDCNDCIENLVNLKQLETLCISANDTSLDMIPINNHIILLGRLEKLTFKFTNFEWERINILARLPNLRVLKLLDFACVGEMWEMQEEESFCQLIFLQIVSTDLKHWNGSDYHFPKLKLLCLDGCDELEEIPACFAEIATLKSIKLRDCLPSAVASAKAIQEEQYDCGNDEMVVIESDEDEYD